MTKDKEDLTYKPLVSVALTTFNGKDFLKQQLDSILEQTYKNFEVVISDDGSDKDTIDILNDYINKDPRIRWSKNPLSRGFVTNSQNAISLCRGEIIVLCDQDDVWYPDKLEEHVKVYRDPNIGWAFNRFVITDDNNKEKGFIEDDLPDYFRHKTMLENTWGSCIGAAQTSYRAELIRSTIPFPTYVPAHDSWIQLAIYPAKPAFIPKILNTYRQHDGQQVGMVGLTDIEAIRKKETEAIANNRVYLWKLSFNTQLPVWKRLYFLNIYIAKQLRSLFRHMLGRSDSSLQDYF